MPKAQGLPRELRLRTSRDFRCVFDNANRIGGRVFTLLTSRNDYAYPRLGISVAKKNVKKAVARNRIKRAIRASFREIQGNLAGVDIIVIVKHAAGATINQELFEQLEKQWQKLIAYYQKS